MSGSLKDASKYIDEIITILEELREISKTQQKLLTKKELDPITSSQLIGSSDFASIMDQREQLLGRLEDRKAYFLDIINQISGLNEIEEIQLGKARIKDTLDSLLRSDHYVMEALALVQQGTASSLLKIIKFKEMSKGYHETKKANDLITRIFGDNPRRIDTRR